ncbi:type II secretion system protein N [Paraferrimonas haliotis]|uniref:Type II secretion system protein N n=1 Tax=Paraferrimonas haliotis TaxID=2013866 RepID=A0AA37WXF9_9GAMM|nr:type II secretion system protein N [Paraferrimonas haliotis]GLS83464.1 type II secretion system protein N [Paraferrimonas haliotis]
MSKLKIIIASILLYLVFMVALFPARFAVKLAPLPNHVQLNQVSGSLWQGKVGQLVVGRYHIDQLAWEMHPWQLFTGEAALSFTVGKSRSSLRGHGDIGYGLSGLRISQLKVIGDISYWAPSTMLPLRSKATGQVEVFIANYQQGQPYCESMQGQVEALTLDVNNQFGEFPLGDIRLDLSCDNGKLLATASEDANQLGAQGQFSLDEGGVYQLSASIRKVDSQPEQLQKALSFLGKPDAKGRYPLEFSGKIPGF